MSSNYIILRDIFRKVNQIGNIKAILSWDSSAKMPELGHKNRTQQMLLLTEISQNMLVENEIRDLIAEAKLEDLAAIEQANLHLIEHYINHKFAVPKALYKKFQQAGLECEFIWRKARQENDYKSFSGKFSEVLNYVREIAALKAEKLELETYDSLLDYYEPGLRQVDFADVFVKFKQVLPDLVKEITARQKQPKYDLTQISIPLAKQRKICEFLSQKIGLDILAARLDESAHPFCGGYKNDVRITTRYSEFGFLESMMGVIHETGHGIYESNLPEAYMLDFVGQALGMAVHESQSLFYEMQLARTPEFSEFLANYLKDNYVSDNPEYFSAENLYLNQTKVSPGLIRVNADEVTYPLHIILRYELERDLILGKLDVADLPEIWRVKMKEYLGVIVKDDKDGCMQDIHWTDGSFGYFPTYSLGAIIAANLKSKMANEISDYQVHIRQGNFTRITQFLKENLQQHGQILPAKERISKICGEFINADNYLAYLRHKYLA